MKEALIRGQILTMLYELRPNPITKTTIEQAMVGYIPASVDSALDYLQQRGYVTAAEKPHPYKEKNVVNVVKITADGIDVVERSKPAQGVCLGG